jgi:hypothetical protein
MTATTQLSRGFRNFRFTKATEAASFLWNPGAGCKPARAVHSDETAR